jgi:hypothetical protein
MRIRKKRMRPRRVLRGAKLEGAAIRELSDLSSWKDLPLTWAALAQRLGVSRQAIATKSAVQLAYNEAHKRLKAASEDQYSPEAIARRTSAKNESLHLRRKLKSCVPRETNGLSDGHVLNTMPINTVTIRTSSLSRACATQHSQGWLLS